MADAVIISERGQITLPARLRKKYSLDKDTPIILEETEEGLLLRKASMIPITQYSNKELKEWLKEDKILPKDKKWLK